MLYWSILQYFWPALSYNRSWKPIFCLLFGWSLKAGPPPPPPTPPFIAPMIILTFTSNLKFALIHWQLPSSLAHAIRFKHGAHSPEVTLVLRLTASHNRVAHAKQASCLLHWLSMFVVAVPLFHFTLTKPLIRFHIKYKIVSFPKL